MTAVTQPNYSNMETAVQHRKETIDKQREEQVQQIQHLGTKEWLETKLDEQAKPVAIFDREFGFRPIGSETVEEIIQLASQEAAKTEGVEADNLDDVDPGDMEDMPKLLREMRETLGEHCTDPQMDATAFGKLPVDTLQETFEEVAMGGELSESQRERARKFRG